MGPSLIESTIVALLAQRKPSASICPSEVARAIHPGDEAAWRALMPEVRNTAQTLADQGVLRITRKGEVVGKEELHHGAIRLARGTRFKPMADE
jgi:hypothetical protein